MNFEPIDILSKEDIINQYYNILEIGENNIPIADSYCNCRTCSGSWTCGSTGSTPAWRCYCPTYSYTTYICGGCGSCPGTGTGTGNLNSGCDK